MFASSYTCPLVNYLLVFLQKGPFSLECSNKNYITGVYTCHNPSNCNHHLMQLYISQTLSYNLLFLESLLYSYFMYLFSLILVSQFLTLLCLYNFPTNFYFTFSHLLKIDSFFNTLYTDHRFSSLHSFQFLLTYLSHRDPHLLCLSLKKNTLRRDYYHTWQDKIYNMNQKLSCQN